MRQGKHSFMTRYIVAFAAKESPKRKDHHDHQHHGSVRKLFVFGDSYADTGNSKKASAVSWKAPYGITFPGKPAGRFSNGRVLTDYLGIISIHSSGATYNLVKTPTLTKVV